MAVIEAHDLTKVYDAGVEVGRAARRHFASQTALAWWRSSVHPAREKARCSACWVLWRCPPAAGFCWRESTSAPLTDDQRSLLRRRRIGFVFQQFNLLPIFTAAENVALPLRLDGMKAAEANRRAVEMLELVGLAERRGPSSQPAVGR